MPFVSEAIVAKTIKRSLVFLAAENDHVVAILKKDRQTTNVSVGATWCATDDDSPSPLGEVR